MRALVAALLFGATVAHAQVAPNRNAQRLFASEVADAPGIWVNPAGLGLAGTLSVSVDFTVGRASGATRLDQVSLGFNSHHFAFGYQRDRLFTGATGHTYRLGVWGTDGRLAVGFAGTLYAGAGDGGRAVDLGALYLLSPRISVGAVLENLGQPTVRSVPLRMTLVPAVSLHTPGRGLVLLAQARLQSDSVLGFSSGAQAAIPLRVPVRLVARMDTDGDFDRTGFTFAVLVGGRDQVGLQATTPGDAGRIDAASLHGMSARPTAGSGRGF